jgi:6-pyruvoyl-tetrahydropterin synthase
MYKITKGIHVHFGHVVQGHSGLCLGPHGHTWLFEVTLGADALDKEGFVCDFSSLKKSVLSPVEKALDHSFAMGSQLYSEVQTHLHHMGDILLNTRADVHGVGLANEHQARNEALVKGIDLDDLDIFFLGGVKCCVFNFTPTSERLAKWLFDIADGHYRGHKHIRVINARVYETLQPVASYCEYSP